ncbi:mannonate dehydratase [Neiella marina]|uniref:Mannonate dehydratase n=1 Tax=Neiella holothuriorum TaxID=2870530 RepID=A0ABS7EE44_9GAMM|nr:mannonate dehydratase [Neiella holothuriorum]MBW8190607.1 mannonate dehydratase [Neiella holothuriorum]
MQETWRWYGPDDTVSLKNVVQAGASGIVSSLHHVETGDVWSYQEVIARKLEVEAAGLSWSVVESIPVHNDIKTRTGNYLQLIENYKESIRSIGKAGIKVVCYNFMPVVDWTRTDLTYQLDNESFALRFEMTDFIAYDVHILARNNASEDYSDKQLEKAKARFEAMSNVEKQGLEENIIAGLPGGEGSYDRESIRQTIGDFIALGTEGLRHNLIEFLRAIIPVAEEYGVNMCIHPDDPPFSLFGLPRVVSTADDIRALIQAVRSPANGLTMCAGSFGARGDNDLVGMVKEFASIIHFAHLRNVIREEDGSFFEAEHLYGDNDMIGIIKALLDEEQRRKSAGLNSAIAMRPDHGHLMGDEVTKPGVNPGYSFGGRMKGLAELRGVIHTLKSLNT